MGDAARKQVAVVLSPYQTSRIITWFVPVKTVNPLNNRQHWRKVAQRGAEEKELTLLHAPRNFGKVTLPCVVYLTRYSSRVMDAHDGLRAACKHIADGVAEWVGVDDREGDGIRFQYEQEVTSRGCQPGVAVTIVQGARIVETLHFVDAMVNDG